HEQRRRVGEVLLLAFVGRVLRRLEAMLAEGERHRRPEVLDRGDLGEDLLQAGGGGNIVLTGLDCGLYPGLPLLVAEQPVKAVQRSEEHTSELQSRFD